MAENRQIAAVSIKSQIPNSITLINMLCGMLGIMAVTRGYVEAAFYLMIIAAIADFFDGMVARWLMVSSPIGKDLDSLADVVTFGVLPSFMMLYLFELNGTEAKLLPFAFIPGLFSALRLAKFNNDSRQSEGFIGVPTPANALFIGSIAVIGSGGASNIYNWLYSSYALVGLSLVTSALLVSELRLIALKFKSLAFSSNRMRYFLILISVLVLILFAIKGLTIQAIPIIFVCYILTSIADNYLNRNEIQS